MLSEISTLLSDYVPLEIPELRRKSRFSQILFDNGGCSSALEWTIIASNQQNSRHVVQSNASTVCGKNGAI
jgi:hypothetical protein